LDPSDTDIREQAKPTQLPPEEVKHGLSACKQSGEMAKGLLKRQQQLQVGRRKLLLLDTFVCGGRRSLMK
jgi:hypothetical protein